MRGMFAFALWDERRQRLLIARRPDRREADILCAIRDGLLFGSEIKAILPGARRPCAAPPGRVRLPGGRLCAWRAPSRALAKLPPGHRLVFERGRRHRYRCYWRATSRGTAPTAHVRGGERRAGQPAHGGRALSPEERRRSRCIPERRNRLLRPRRADAGSGGAGEDVLGRLPRCGRRLQRVRVMPSASRNWSAPSIASSSSRAARAWSCSRGSSGTTTSPTVNRRRRSCTCYLNSRQRHVKVAVGGTGGDETSSATRAIAAFACSNGITASPPGAPGPCRKNRPALAGVHNRQPLRQACQAVHRRQRPATRGSVLPGSACCTRDVRRRAVAGGQGPRRGPERRRSLRQQLLGDPDASVLDRAASLDIEGYLPRIPAGLRGSDEHGARSGGAVAAVRLSPRRFRRSLPVDYRLHKMTQQVHLQGGCAPLVAAAHRRPAQGRLRIADRPVVQGRIEAVHSRTSSRPRSRDSPAARRRGRAADDRIASLGRARLPLQSWSILTLEGLDRMYIEDCVGNGTDYTIRDFRGEGLIRLTVTITRRSRLRWGLTA